MRSMGTRRAALIAGATTVTAMTLSACSAGQVAETSNKEPSIYGVNLANANGSVLVRSLAVTYGAVQGYPAGGNAPVEVGLYNETKQPVTVRITSQPPAEPEEGVVSARQVGITGAATPSADPSTLPAGAEPSGSRPAAQKPGPGQSTPPADQQNPAGASAPATPTLAPTPAEGPLRPAEITIAPLDSVIFKPGDSQALQLVGLSGPLRPGFSANLVFTFSNGAPPLEVEAPVGVPLSPAPRGSVQHEGVGEEPQQGEAPAGEGH